MDNKKNRDQIKKAIAAGLSGNVAPLKQHLYSGIVAPIVYQRISLTKVKISSGGYGIKPGIYTDSDFQNLLKKIKEDTGRDQPLIQLRRSVISRLASGEVVENYVGYPITNTPILPNSNQY